MQILLGQTLTLKHPQSQHLLKNVKQLSTPLEECQTALNKTQL